MTASVKDNCLMTVTGNPGTGTVTVGAAVSGYQALAAGDDANTFDMHLYSVDGNGNPNGLWETQKQSTWTNSGTTLSRSAGNVVDGSSGAGVLVNFSSGSQRVAVVFPSERGALVASTQSSNQVLASPDGSSGRPSYRSLVEADLALSAVACGRLTLQSGTAISTSDQTAKSTVYFTPRNGRALSVYNGTLWQVCIFSELSLALSGLTSAKNYDVWGYISGGALAIDLGPAWTSDTARGAGAGTTELEVFQGVEVNKNSLTTLITSASVSARQARYLGTLRTTGTTTTEDSQANRYVWNRYQQERRVGYANVTGSHTIQNVGTPREWANGTGARANFVTGLSQQVRGDVAARVAPSGAGANVFVYIGVTGATANVFSLNGTATVVLTGFTSSLFNALLGFNYVSAYEAEFGNILATLDQEQTRLDLWC